MPLTSITCNDMKGMLICSKEYKSRKMSMYIQTGARITYFFFLPSMFLLILFLSLDFCRTTAFLTLTYSLNRRGMAEWSRTMMMHWRFALLVFFRTRHQSKSTLECKCLCVRECVSVWDHVSTYLKSRISFEK